MFTPAPFVEADADGIAAMLARAPFGVLVTVDADGAPAVSHLPMLWDPARGEVIGHLARNNPQAVAKAARGLAIAPGPAAYISPGWYPSKRAHGRVVPTWNYEAVHATGALEWTEEPAELLAIVTALSARFEAGRAEPWAPSDAPTDYMDAMLGGITGVRMRIETLEAKRKLSQNRPEADRRGVIAGLSASPSPGDQAVAGLMQDLER